MEGESHDPGKIMHSILTSMQKKNNIQVVQQ